MGGATRSSTSILHERRIRQLNVVRRHSGRSKGSHALSNLRRQVRYDEQPNGSEDPELRKGQACAIFIPQPDVLDLRRPFRVALEKPFYESLELPSAAVYVAVKR
jgi:hypothetical protein